MEEAPVPADVDRRPRWRAWLPRIFAVAVLLAAGAVVLVRTEVIGGPTAAERTATVTADLNRRMTTTLEQLPSTGHEGHGTATSAESRTICGTRVYGYEPADANSSNNPYEANEIRQLSAVVRKFVEQLPERERTIIKGHYSEHQEFQTIAAQLSITKGRVAQLHARALQRLREALERAPKLDRKL